MIWGLVLLLANAAAAGVNFQAGNVVIGCLNVAACSFILVTMVKM